MKYFVILKSHADSNNSIAFCRKFVILGLCFLKKTNNITNDIDYFNENQSKLYLLIK